MLPSAAGVIDPLLSTGFPLTLLGIGRLLELLEGTSEGAEREAALALMRRSRRSNWTRPSSWSPRSTLNMSDVPLFKRLSLLYFAAASFSEAARRLGRSELAPGFLLHAHSAIRPRASGVCGAGDGIAARAPPRRAARIASTARSNRSISRGCSIAPAATGTRVLSDDLLGSASKLDSTVEEIHRLLERCGFVSSRETKIL